MASGGIHGLDRANVNFVCQRCCQPLKLDPSFSYLDEHIINDLTVALIVNSDTSDAITLMPDDSKLTAASSSDVEISRKQVPPVRLTESGNGFMIVGDAGNGDTDMDSLSYHLKVTARLFDIMSDQSDIDHPLCEECTDALLDHMDLLLKTTEDECTDYRDFLDKLEKEPCDDDSDALDEELKVLNLEKERLERELKFHEEERRRSETELRRQREERDRLDAEEERYWKEYCYQKRLLLQHESEQRSVENQLKCAQAQWDKLRKTNVFNATFHIWHSGQFGTINNFRLGRLPNVAVEWNEINAAWGQTVLLLHSMARKIDLTFQRYRLVPYGNRSYLESLTDKSRELPLYGSGGFRFFWDTKFDQAMVAFLDCLQQEEVEKGDTGFRLPYKMDKGRIEDTSSGNSYSVKIQFNSEEQWTKALKFMLTNLRWGLAWVASQFNNK